MGFGYRLKSSVVILPAPAHLFNTVLPAVEIYHLMQHRVQRFFNRIVQNLGGNIQLIRTAIFTLPNLGGGTMAVCPRLALHGDDMKVGSPMIQFMTLLLERTRQTRDCKITQVLKLELPMGQIQKLMVAMITLD